jgi:hypothetical protein
VGDDDLAGDDAVYRNNQAKGQTTTASALGTVAESDVNTDGGDAGVSDSAELEELADNYDAKSEVDRETKIERITIIIGAVFGGVVLTLGVAAAVTMAGKCTSYSESGADARHTVAFGTTEATLPTAAATTTRGGAGTMFQGL